jgi:hypothetical protein
MKSIEIQEMVYNWALEQSFNAPYGVLTGTHGSKRGRTVLSVTFGRARTLDATVEIYNSAFIVVRTSRFGSRAFKSVAEMMDHLKIL